MIAIIPARGGSKRIPRKNIKIFHGKPIIQYSIETAEKSGLFKEIIVSIDSFDSEIEIIARNLGALVHIRPDELSGDEAGTQEVCKDVLMTSNYLETGNHMDIACCIYATSPLLSVEDLARGLVLLKTKRGMNYAFSVGTEPLRDAGNFYWGYREAFLAGIPVHSEHSIMVPIDESRVQDINTPEDWVKAEEKYARLNRKVLERK